MNEAKFTGKAGVYAKYRPSYPGSFLDYLYGEVGFTPQSIIADIGAGTGKLTELLLERGNTVFAIEPNADMRSAAESALRKYPGFRSSAASAENTGLDSASTDFITVAQAFHWFDQTAFRAECRRILRSGGKVTLVWNSRDSGDAFVAERDELNRRFCPDFMGSHGGRRGASHDDYAALFKNGSYDARTFRNDITLDEAGFIGGSLSGSYAPKEGDPHYDEYVSELRRLFAKYARSGSLIMPNVTQSYTGEV